MVPNQFCALVLLVFSCSAAGLQMPLSLGEVSKQECETTHFIHIGKTGGSSVHSWFHKAYKASQKEGFVGNSFTFNQSHGVSHFQLHSHDFLLGQGGPKDCYVFFVRDPVERWVSGFLSRLRKGCPRKWAPWSAEEKNVFTHYPTPEALAQALGSDDSGEQEKALRANNAIRHTRNSFAHYLPQVEKHMDRIRFVGQTHMLETDFEHMCQASGLPAGRPFKHKAEYQNPPELEHLKRLTSEAHANVRRLLDPDYIILDKLAQNGFSAALNSEKTKPQDIVQDMSVEEYIHLGNFKFFDDDEDAVSE